MNTARNTSKVCNFTEDPPWPSGHTSIKAFSRSLEKNTVKN